jgi:hypothetical protein
MNGFVIYDRVERHYHKPGGGFTKDVSEAKVFFSEDKALLRRLDSFREDVVRVRMVPQLCEEVKA